MSNTRYDGQSAAPIGHRPVLALTLTSAYGYLDKVTVAG